MKLLCLSDIHGEAAGLQDFLQEAGGVDALIVAGDITHLGGPAEARAILDPLLASGVRVLAVAGNMDREGVRGLLRELEIDLHGRGLVVGSVGFMGLGGGTRSPFGTPWELSEADARNTLASGVMQISSASFKVLVSHAPPQGTRIDRSTSGRHVGSKPVREFLLSGAVNLCISGHIHESPGEDTLGSALCLNLGPFKDGRYALVTIEGSQAHVSWRKR